jgi:hypothetical protein
MRAAKNARVQAAAAVKAAERRASIFTTITPATVQARVGTLDLINSDIGELYQGRIERAYERTGINGNLGDRMENPLLKDFFTLHSSADGYNCLVHSILTVGCENFRGLSQEDKNIVAENFRRYVIPNTPQYIAKINTPEEIQARKIWNYIQASGLPRVGGNITEADIHRIEEIRNSIADRNAGIHGELPDFNTQFRVGTRYVYLDSGDLSRLCEFLGITVKLFNLRDRIVEGSNEPLYGAAALPIYMMYNNGSHYEGVVKSLYLGESIPWDQLFESQLLVRQEMLGRSQPDEPRVQVSPGQWICPACTLVNEAGATKCVACGMAKPAAAASPSAVAAAASPSAVAAAASPAPVADVSPLYVPRPPLYPRPGRGVPLRPIEGSSAGTWECAVCGTSNKASAKECDVCGTKKPGAPAPAPAASVPPLYIPRPPLYPRPGRGVLPQPTEVPAVGNWECAVCTYSNKASAKECDICGTKKPVSSPLAIASPVLPPLRGNPNPRMSQEDRMSEQNFQALLQSTSNPFLGGRRSQKQRTRRRRQTVRQRRRRRTVRQRRRIRTVRYRR